MAWIDRLKRDAENQLRWGDWLDAIELMDARVCDDGMARLIGREIRGELNVSDRMARKRDKKVAAMLNSIGYTSHQLWIDGNKRRAWIRPTTADAAIRKPGRPKGSKDAPGVKRNRRWAKRPPGVDAKDWRRQRRSRGLP